MNDELKRFIAESAARITPARLEKLIRLLPQIRLAVTQVHEFPHLADQVEFLAEIIEDFYSGLSRDIPYTAIAESAFALLYVHKHLDIIPDDIPGMGRADDAAIVTTVFEHYKQPFLAHVLAQRTRKPVES
jgi:uncharacterized membrane protein YkvA (DUF1232 family)